MTTPQTSAERALAGELIVNIGQIKDGTPERRELDRLVRRGDLERWRGYWYPVAGAAYGIGSLKTCWSRSRAAAGV